MSNDDLSYLSATEAAALIRDGSLSPVDLVENALARIEEVNPTLNCFCFTYPAEAVEQAQAAERAIAAGDDVGPLHGVPIAIKDLTPTKGKTTTFGSHAYKDWVPDYDALVVQRLRDAGAIMVGKTTTPEFAFSSLTDSPLWGHYPQSVESRLHAGRLVRRLCCRRGLRLRAARRRLGCRRLGANSRLA